MDRDRYNRRSVSKDNRGRYRDNSRNRNGSRRRDSPDRSGRRRNSRDRSHDKRDRDRDHRSSAAADDRPAKKVRYDSEVINGKNNENSNGVYAKENQSPTQPSQAEKDDEEELKGLASLYEKDGADDNEDEELDFLIPKKNKEEEEAARLAEERRRRKEEILSKYKKENSDDAVATANADSTNTKPTVENKLKDLAIKDLSNDGVDHKESVGEQYVNEGKQLEAERVAVQREEELQKEKLAFDMFSASPSDLEKAKSGRVALAEALMEGEDPHLQSNWDDGEGYYKARIGELIGDRFRILGIVGKGVFSTVLKCLDVRKSNLAAINGDTASEDQFHVAVKMIRSNDTMRRAAEKEKQILLAITQRDPDDKRHCVKLITHLEYRNHVALVFEYQQMNLRETLKKFGKDVGINIGAVRMYARQLFSALRLLMELRVVHADLKLDNILCSGDLKQVKICDFGSAFFENDTDNDPTPYLVSRFYRAPEIILGLPYDRAIDMWSVCVCLYELFSGHVMFPGRTNNEMLRLMMVLKGRFPNKMLKSHLRSYENMSLEPHFDPDLKFRQYEVDAISGKVVLRVVDINNPTKDLPSVLRSFKAGADDVKLVSALTDLLDKGLNLDPAKRLTVNDALKHPLFTVLK